MWAAVILSFALHGGLVLALQISKSAPEEGDGVPIINIRLTHTSDGDAQEDEFSGETENNEPVPSIDNVEEIPLPDAEPRIARLDENAIEPQDEPIGAPPPSTPAPSSPPPSPAPSSTPQEITPQESTPPAGDPAEEASVETTAPVDAPTERPQVVEDRPDATVERGEEAIASAETESIEPVTQTISMPDAQKEMLDKQFSEWAETAYSMEESQPSVAWEHGGQQYTATFEQVPAQGTMDIDELIVEVSTEENGNRLSTQMRMKRLAFSSFAQFVDRWDPKVRIHDDEIDGRFHSNSEIYLDFGRGVKPLFRGKVTTASRRINTSHSGGPVPRREMFLDGVETGVRRIVLPKEFLPFSGDAEFGEDQVHYLEEDTRITFYSDGTYGWRYVKSSSPEQKRSIPDTASYIVAARKKELHIKGIVSGRVLVYSPERIVIEDDLVYASDPRVASTDDYLGLVSDRSIEVARPDITGPGDLSINGSIYARRQFVVSDYRARGNGTLFIFGSLAAGSVTATEPRFATKIEFDRRLNDMRPPSFPMTDRYAIEAWDGEWMVEPCCFN